VYGADELQARVARAIEAAAYDGAPPVPGEIREMRERLGQTARGLPASEDDLKLGPGGLIELQFLVQLWLLVHGRDRPELRTTRTRIALERLAESGFIEDATAKLLTRAHDRLRQALNFRRLVSDDASSLPPDQPTTGELGELEMSLAEARRHIRETYRRVLGSA
jgi:glutamate-ammonia-ligase adenylyltransferase